MGNILIKNYQKQSVLLSIKLRKYLDNLNRALILSRYKSIDGMT